MIKISYAIQQMISFYKGNIHDIDHQILLEIYYLVNVGETYKSKETVYDAMVRLLRRISGENYCPPCFCTNMEVYR